MADECGISEKIDEMLRKALADILSAADRHLDGVTWLDAPVPSRWHRCKAESRCSSDHGLVERCACGARRDGGRGQWVWRNSKSREDVK